MERSNVFFFQMYVLLNKLCKRNEPFIRKLHPFVHLLMSSFSNYRKLKRIANFCNLDFQLHMYHVQVKQPFTERPTKYTYL